EKCYRRSEVYYRTARTFHPWRPVTGKDYLKAAECLAIVELTRCCVVNGRALKIWTRLRRGAGTAGASSLSLSPFSWLSCFSSPCPDQAQSPWVSESN